MRCNDPGKSGLRSGNPVALGQHHENESEEHHGFLHVTQEQIDRAASLGLSSRAIYSFFLILNGCQALLQVLKVNRLQKVLVETNQFRLDSVKRKSMSRHCEESNMPQAVLTLDDFGDLVACHSRHSKIEQHNIWSQTVDQFHAILSIMAHMGIVA
jgi:hypothetical protein